MGRGQSNQKDLNENKQNKSEREAPLRISA